MMKSNEALIFWRLVLRIRSAKAVGALTAEMLADTEDELAGMAMNTEWAAMKAQIGRARGRLDRMRHEAA